MKSCSPKAQFFHVALSLLSLIPRLNPKSNTSQKPKMPACRPTNQWKSTPQFQFAHVIPKSSPSHMHKSALSDRKVKQSTYNAAGSQRSSDTTRQSKPFHPCFHEVCSLHPIIVLLFLPRLNRCFFVSSCCTDWTAGSAPAFVVVLSAAA